MTSKAILEKNYIVQQTPRVLANHRSYFQPGVTLSRSGEDWRGISTKESRMLCGLHLQEGESNYIHRACGLLPRNIIPKMDLVESYA
jgi:hypothetical protein